MRLKRRLVSGFLAMILTAWIVVGTGSAQELNMPFPSYGTGPVEVRLYTDYFCTPCRALEPVVEPILRDLLKKNAIHLTFVDISTSEFSPMYARYFLFALKEKSDFEHALRFRNLLNEAAASMNVLTQEGIETLFKEKGISYSSWDTKPAVDRYNTMIKEDKITGTPNCIMIRDGKRIKISGIQGITYHLKQLQ
ncbi:MAG: DsbA family protein [Syntrophales bacterium]